jgi:DNA-binding MarR family transcriptional regulator
VSETKESMVAELERSLPFLMRGLFWQAENCPLSDLTLEQMRMMRLLERHGQLRVSQLAAELVMTPSAVTQMSYRLRDLGLVEREEVAGDGRGRGLSLSVSGKRQMSERRELRVQHAVRLVESVPLESLAAVLEAVRSLMAQIPSPDPAESLEFLDTLIKQQPNSA